MDHSIAHSTHTPSGASSSSSSSPPHPTVVVPLRRVSHARRTRLSPEVHGRAAPARPLPARRAAPTPRGRQLVHHAPARARRVRRRRRRCELGRAPPLLRRVRRERHAAGARQQPHVRCRQSRAVGVPFGVSRCALRRSVARALSPARAHAVVIVVVYRLV